MTSWKISVAVSTLLICISTVGTASELSPIHKPEIGDQYLDLMVTYACYGQDIWLEDEAGFGGSWGLGIRDPNGNGGVRGTCNVLYSHALLISAWNYDQLTPEQKAQLEECSLGKTQMLALIERNLHYLAAYHKSSTENTEKKWGRSWQSSLWSGAMGMGALLIWPELSEKGQDRVRQIAFDEADQVSSREPRSGDPGDTKAEELGWDTHALALALAVEPKHANAPEWWESLKRFAANTFSMRSDHDNNDQIGEDIIKEIVTTVNVRDDYTVWNHGFFHPDYVQVSAQELGEAWLLLALGDRLHGTGQAEAFHPYTMHNVEKIWQQVMRYLVLPWGELAFPANNDWTFHTSVCNGYLAWIGTQLNEPLAALAEKRGIRAAQLRQANSPKGRILADSNLQWFWEPLLVKRLSSAYLFHALNCTPEVTESTASQLDRMQITKYLSSSGIWLKRNSNYFVSISTQNPQMGHFIPFDPKAKNPYFTLPLSDGIVPEGVARISQLGRSGTADVAVLLCGDGSQCILVSLPRSVVWISPNGFRYLGLENDQISGGGRDIAYATGAFQVPALVPGPPLKMDTRWLNVDSTFAMAIDSGTYEYHRSGGYNRRSAALDKILPVGANVWQMFAGGSVEDTHTVAEFLHADITDETARVMVQDGPNGKSYRIDARLKTRAYQLLGPKDIRTDAETQPQHSVENMFDFNPNSFAVFTCPEDVSPEACEALIELPIGDSRQLYIQPRPGYGPLEISLKVFSEKQEVENWNFKISDEAIQKELPEGDSIQVILKGCPHPSRPNMQIAELHLLKQGERISLFEPEELKDVRVAEM